MTAKKKKVVKPTAVLNDEKYPPTGEGPFTELGALKEDVNYWRKKYEATVEQLNKLDRAHMSVLAAVRNVLAIHLDGRGGF